MMPLASPVLGAGVRMSDADYPGVVRQVNSTWRIVADMDCQRYVLQTVFEAGGVSRWAVPRGRCPNTVDKIVAKFGADVPGLAAAFHDLPDDPAEAQPMFAASRRGQASAFDLTDWRRASYGRVVASDGQMRIAVTPCGTLYRLQWIEAAQKDRLAAEWRTMIFAPSLAPLREYVLTKVYEPDTHAKGEALLPRWEAMTMALPEVAADGIWPALPARPDAA